MVPTRTELEQARLRRLLQRRLEICTALPLPRVLLKQESLEGEARKYLVEWTDGARTEVVLMRYRERYSGCISTQVGCACDCAFCATGQLGFVRQLSSDEIVAQVLFLQREMAHEGRLLSNFVLMGMGEPLLNYEATLAAIRRLVDPRGAAFVERRITLSTVGIAPGIERLAKERLGIRLAVSLHAATDELRNQLVPINRRWPLDALFSALHFYAQQKRQRIMFEWVLINGVTDTPEQAQALVARLAGLPAHINLIQLNPTPRYAGLPSSPQATQAFVTILDKAGIPHTMRQRRGIEISAGCGQLGWMALSSQYHTATDS